VVRDGDAAELTSRESKNAGSGPGDTRQLLALLAVNESGPREVFRHKWRAWYRCSVSEGNGSEGKQAISPAEPREPEWPSHFPARGCPPNDAVPVQGRVYRRCGSGDGDWKSAAERGAFKNKPAAIRAALSSYLDLELLREKVAVHEEWWIAFADLAAEHGKIKQTEGPGHYSLWLTRAALAARDELFKRIE
jgi:hypothetical protein